MEVKLLAYTPGPAGIVAAAARCCYSAKPASELLDTSIPAAHGSCFEHISFTFSVEGVSRVLTHQLVRHRVGTAFSQQSMRYVDVHKLWDHIVIPKTVQDKIDEAYALAEAEELIGSLEPEHMASIELAECYEGLQSSIGNMIEAMTKAGIPSEDQRYFVPMGVKSNITVTMNARELQHFCGLRRCKRAQWEIRELADKMATLVQGECPDLCQHLNLGPQCEQLGYCPEHKSCGHKPTFIKIEEMFDNVPVMAGECKHCGACKEAKE